MRCVRVVILLLSVLCSLSSCCWQEAKNIIAIADSIDQNENVIYDDTMALKKVICVLDNPIGRLFHKNLLGKAYYYMGRNLEDSYQQIAAAAECYIEADRMQIDNPIYRGRVNSCMGYICEQNNNDSLALIFYERAGDNFRESKDDWYYAQNLLSIVPRYINLQLYTKADSILAKAKLYQLDSTYLARYYETRGLYFYAQQQYDSALVYFNEGSTYWHNEEDRCFSYLKIMQAHHNKHQMDSAICYAQRILSFSKNPNYISNAYYCLMQEAKEKSDVNRLSQYAHARMDLGNILRNNTNKYAEAITLLDNYLQNPHPWRWQWFMVLSIALVCAITIMFINYRKHADLQLQFASNMITNMSSQLEDQGKELNIACQKNHQAKMIDEIRIKYPTPPNKWNDYCRLKTDINPYLSTWLTALEELNLTNREKVLCTFIFLYPYLSVEELAKFMCMTKGGVQVIRTHVVKKVGITSRQLVDYLQELSEVE